MRFLAPLSAIALSISAPVAAAEVVPVAPFHALQLRGGGTAVVRPGPVQRVTILSGSTQFTSFHMRPDGQLIVDVCNDRCPHNYDLQLLVESPRAPDVAIKGGGAITISPGFAPQSQLSAAIDGGGRIDARAVTARQMSAAVNGGGKILLGRSSALSAAVKGGGDIRYAGNPTVARAVSGGGSIQAE